MKKHIFKRYILISSFLWLFSTCSVFADSTQITPASVLYPRIGHTFVWATGSAIPDPWGWWPGFAKYLMMVPATGKGLCPAGSTPRVIVVPNIAGGFYGPIEHMYAYTFNWNTGLNAYTSVPNVTEGWYYSIGVVMATRTYNGTDWNYRPWITKVLWTLYCEYNTNNQMQQ